MKTAMQVFLPLASHKTYGNGGVRWHLMPYRSPTTHSGWDPDPQFLTSSCTCCGTICRATHPVVAWTLRLDSGRHINADKLRRALFFFLLVLYLHSFSLSLSFRMYPIKKVPLEAEALTDWLYKRFEEKEALLAHFYKTGQSKSVSLSLFLLHSASVFLEVVNEVNESKRKPLATPCFQSCSAEPSGTRASALACLVLFSSNSLPWNSAKIILAKRETSRNYTIRGFSQTLKHDGRDSFM